MSRNGSGVYNLPANTWYPAVNGVTATAADWNTTATDIQAALTQSVSSDGQTPMTGNLAMGNNKVTGLANGTANTDAAAYGQLAQFTPALYLAQCRLTKSGANLLLSRFNGAYLTINGTSQLIPAAGVTLSPTGVAGTTYYIYAFMSGSTMTLEASTTTHATDATTGIEIKSGDATRTLVGMARAIAGPAWVDTITQRLAISWFNRKPIQLQAVLTAVAGNFSTGTYTVLSSSLPLEFLSWAGELSQAKFQGRLANNVINAVSTTATFLDATNTESYTSTQAYAANALQPVYCSLDIVASEGFHTFNVYAQQDVVSTASYAGSATPGGRCVHSAVIQG